MNDSLSQAIVDHIARHIGRPTDVLHELIPTSDLHIDIHVIKPTKARPFYTLVTNGMSARAMTIAPKYRGQVSPYLELMLALPRDWRVDRPHEDRWAWPVAWLKLLAAYPHEQGTWLGPP